MNILNRTPFLAAPLATMIRPPSPSVTVVVKGTFRIIPGATAAVEAVQEPLTGDVFVDEDPEKRLLYASDFAPFKTRADLLLLGDAYAPGGAASEAMAVAFRVGPWSKKLVAVGERPLSRMSLGYDRAYGGTDDKRNPLGTRHPGVLRAEDVGSESPEIAGFGPYPMMWPQRYAKVGTYGAKWLEERWPGYAEDMDWGFWNAAPEDQQIPYLQGDEEIEFENLHPKYSRFASRLPGFRVRCFLHDEHEGKMRFREVPMNLDTLTARPDRELVHLVWRGAADVASAKLKGISDILVVSEEAGKAQSAEQYRESFHAELRRRNEEPVQPPGEPAIRPAASAPSLRDRIRRKESFPGEDLTGADLSGADLSGLVFRDAVLARANLAGAKAANADFSGANLSRADLSGADLSQAKLIAANLEGANLEKTDLSGTKLDKADFSLARLAGAKLIGAAGGHARFEFADLTGADFSGAVIGAGRITDCRIDRTNFSKSKLVATQLLRCWGAANFEEADLTNARFNHSFLTGANFRKITAPKSFWEFARLQAADFSEADLLRAEFSDAFLEKARLTKASAKHARFCDASLQRAHIDGADFLQATFEKADLTEADARHSNFYEAEFLGARTEKTLFQNANLKKTKLA